MPKRQIRKAKEREIHSLELSPMADYVPLLVIEYILSFLPVKSLLRFRCVSKQWRSLIDNPSFIYLHVNHSLQTTNHHSLVVQHRKLHHVHFRHHKLHLVNFPALDRAPVLVFPLKENPRTRISIDFLGSCNGLICLCSVNLGRGEIILWNPATKKYKDVPFERIELPRNASRHQPTAYGFGYDRVHDDYKLVKSVRYFIRDPRSFHNEVRVYSLKGNSWRRVPDFPYISMCLHGVYLNGCLHWFLDSKSILAFDLGTEEQKIIPQPKYMDTDYTAIIHVEVLRGCLCVLRNNTLSRADMWVMKEYGVLESWMKVFSIEELDVVRTLHLRPIAYSPDGDEVLLEVAHNDLFWYDLRLKRSQEVKIKGLQSSFDAQVLIESLVPLDGFENTKPGKN